MIRIAFTYRQRINSLKDLRAGLVHDLAHEQAAAQERINLLAQRIQELQLLEAEAQVA